MNQIDKLFLEKQEKILSIYFTAGFPVVNDTAEIIRCLQKKGVDMIEIGMPFSDPMADGPVIRESSNTAIKNGMTLELLFRQLAEVKDVSVPKILMGYFNPVLQYGVEHFCQSCFENNISGVILPDLPYGYFEKHYRSVFERFGIYNILLVAPETPVERIREIDRMGAGFLYVVSTRGVTGTIKGFGSEHDRLQSIASMGLQLPLMMGFGIRDKVSYDSACRYARGGIIGTTFINALKETGTTEEKIARFVSNFR